MGNEISYRWKGKDGARIRITAEPAWRQGNICRFVVDPPLYAGGAAHFANRDATGDSPLARKLFELEGVTEVLIAEEAATLTLENSPDWHQYSEKVAEVIRDHLNSGEPNVTDDFKKKLPSTEKIRARVKDVLDNHINPAVAAHGGFVALLDVQQNNVFLQFGGGCQGCGMIDITLKYGVEKLIRNQVPEVGEILDTTDHASGRNPYYAPSSR